MSKDPSTARRAQMLIFGSLSSIRIQLKSLTLKLLWIKGHCNTHMAATDYRVTGKDLLGNCLADSLATRGAEMAEVYYQDATDVIWYYGAIRDIQRRAAIILSHAVLPYSVKRVREPARQRVPVLARTGALLSSKHTFDVHGKSLQCTQCFQHVPLARQAAVAWLATPCKPDMARKYLSFDGARRPTRVPLGRTIRVGHQVLHAEHKLFLYRGLYFCGDCGYFASRHAQKLTQPCTERGQKALRRVLNLRAGKLPSGMQSWPNDPKRHDMTGTVYPESRT